MFHRILIPTDFSTASEWVFDDAIRIAGSTPGAEVLILHVRMTRTSHPDELRFPADPSLYEYAERQELERLRDRVRRAHVSLPTRLIVRQGSDPGEEINEVAKAEGVDLIVIATHARHHVAHLFIGSTTTSVIQDPPAAILAIRYGIRKRQAMKRVVVPVHLEQKHQGAFELAVRCGAEIHLITVCSEADRGRAESLQRALAERTPNVKTNIVHGSDAQREILRHVTKVDADAIFLNAAATPTEGKLDIIRHAPVPVMIAPA